MGRTAIRSACFLLVFGAAVIMDPPVHGDVSPFATGVVKLDPDASEAERMALAARVRPSPRQVAWQELEFQAFIHFGVNTFTDREWGDGKEDPALFHPARFDANQWVAAFKAAGMRGVVLTAKHHDGFCLWPSAYTEHSVKRSPWKDGKGDVVGELAEACRKGGLKLGIYLSPWDRHEPTYGDSPRYNEHFRNQLTELLTNYGPVSEVWFDGACGEGPNGKRQVYDWDSCFGVIRRLQPDAVISIMGPDVRWCGNEAGRTRESEWSVVPAKIVHSGEADLGSRERIRDADALRWYPAQVNTSIRPGWFFHASQNLQVKSLRHLVDVYFGSVGGNGQFLLNLPPDPRGLIHENDVARLGELGAYLRAAFDENLALGAAASSDQVRGDDPRYGPGQAVDGDRSTWWMPEEGTETAGIELDLGGEQTFNCAMLQERIEEGQRVEAFVLEAFDSGTWREFARSTVIGYKRLLRFDEVKASKVRIRFLASRVCPTLAEFGLYRIPRLLPPPVIQRDRRGMVTITCEPTEGEIRYTLDGTGPSRKSRRYEGPFSLPSGGTVTARAFAPGAWEEAAASAVEFGICPGRWRILFADSEEAEAGEHAANAIDGDPRTIWHTAWVDGNLPQPHEIRIDLGETVPVQGFTYLPRQDGSLNGTIKRYACYLSLDGKDWGRPVSEGEFANIRNNPVLQRVTFGRAVQARYLRLRSLEEVNGNPWTSAAEIGVLKGEAPDREE